MKITGRNIGMGVTALILGAATTLGIEGIVQHPTTPSQQTAQAALQKKSTDFYLTQGVEQGFIYSESTRQNLGRAAMTFKYERLNGDGRARVYMGRELLLLEMDKPTKIEYPYWEGGGTITLISPPSIDENGKSQIYVEVEGSHSIRKWP